MNTLPGIVLKDAIVIQINSKLLRPLRWLLACRMTGEISHRLELLHVSPTDWFCSDGKSAHLVLFANPEQNPIPEGVYHFMTLSGDLLILHKTDQKRFDYKDVLDVDTSVKVSKPGKYNLLLGVSERLLARALNIRGENLETQIVVGQRINVYVSDPHDKSFLKGVSLRAVIMPIVRNTKMGTYASYELKKAE